MPVPLALSVLAKPLPVKPDWLLSMVPCTPQKPVAFSCKVRLTLPLLEEELLDDDELDDDELEDELELLELDDDELEEELELLEEDELELLLEPLPLTTVMGTAATFPGIAINPISLLDCPGGILLLQSTGPIT